jgi:hypothetical protein
MTCRSFLECHPHIIGSAGLKFLECQTGIFFRTVREIQERKIQIFWRVWLFRNATIDFWKTGIFLGATFETSD